MGRSKNHVHVITTDSITAAFGASNQRLRKVKQQLVERLVLDLVQTGKGVKPVMGSMVGSLLGGFSTQKGGGSLLDGPAPNERGRMPSAPSGRSQSRPRSASRSGRGQRR